MAALASANLEQFLWLAGDQFEELIAEAIMRQPTLQLVPERQDLLARRASRALWAEIPRRAHHGKQVSKFLEAVAGFCRQITFQPNAPYDPGLTGVAISMDDRDRLLDDAFLQRHPEHRVLANVLASAIANNLLEPVLDYKCKGTLWMVLYLNRLLCPEYRLPLHFGGFREQSLTQMARWLNQGHRELVFSERLL